MPIVYSDESWRGKHSRYFFSVSLENGFYLVKSSIYRKRKDGDFDCVYINELSANNKDELKNLDYNKSRLADKFLKSDFFKE